MAKETEHTLAVQRRPGQIAIRHIDASGEVGELSEGVDVSLRGGGVR